MQLRTWERFAACSQSVSKSVDEEEEARRIATNKEGKIKVKGNKVRRFATAATARDIATGLVVFGGRRRRRRRRRRENDDMYVQTLSLPSSLSSFILLELVVEIKYSSAESP